MPKWTKQDYVDGLNEFFKKVGLQIDWSKLNLKDLEALSELLGDADKVAVLFGMDKAVDHAVQAGAAAANPLSGLLSGGLMDGELREKVSRVVDGGLDGMVKTLKEEKPLRSQIGSGQFINRLLQLGK